MKKTALNTAIAAALLATSAGALAQPEIGVTVSYVDLGQNVSGETLSTGLIELSGGYAFELDRHFSVTPEARYFTQPSDVTADNGVDLRLKRGLGAAARVQYDFFGHVDDGPFVFVAPAYSRIRAKASFEGTTLVSDSDWKFSVQAGAGYAFDDRFSLELRYEGFDPTNSNERLNTFGLGARYRF